MIIFDPEVEEAAIQGALDQALEVVRTNGGTTGRVDRWGRRTLAYEMNKKREGYYVVAEFTPSPRRRPSSTGSSSWPTRSCATRSSGCRRRSRWPDKVAGRPPRDRTAG